MMETKVGLEAEYLLLDKEGEAVVPPQYFDRDDFPLLGEIRGEPGQNSTETIINFMKKKMEVDDSVSSKCTLAMLNIKRVRLATYKEAMRQVGTGKDKGQRDVRNVYGTDISDFSDQIIGDNKRIQGINTSCGLHIHFSCRDYKETRVSVPQYEQVTLPLTVLPGTLGTEGSVSINLYRHKEYSLEEVMECSASQLNRPAVEYIVKEMDEAFFERFAPSKEERTKYRQPGFYELKPYGFEYRSLPANDETMASLPEIVEKAFHLLYSLNKWDS